MQTTDKGDSRDEAFLPALPTGEEAPGSNFPFLSLPPELRNMVYQSSLDLLPKFTDGATKQAAEPTALFQVCRVARGEMTDAYN